MANERLRAAMVLAGYTNETLAAAAGVQDSTVGRWTTQGRVPHARAAAQVASLLKVSIYELWPSLAPKVSEAKSKPDPDLVCVYPQRGAVPESTWRDMVDTAVGHVDILVYSANFLTDGDADFPKRVKIRNAHGASFRFLFGDPDSAAVALRGSEEGIGPNMGARVGLTLVYMRDLIGMPGIEMRLHGTTLYNSIYRFDDHMLVNAHAYGAPAVQSPVLYLKRTADGRLFRHYLASFDRVWETAKPVRSPYEGAK
jgi:transcriptional regulator with XRE-family HTH domain